MPLFLSIFVGLTLVAPASPPTAQELLAHHAPIFLQNVCDDARNPDALDGRSDLITPVDFAGWDIADAWHNLASVPAADLTAAAYASVVSTASHSYLLFAVWHPRDFSAGLPFGLRVPFDSHSGDLEGALLVVDHTLADDGLGEVVAAVSVWHRALLPASGAVEGRLPPSPMPRLTFDDFGGGRRAVFEIEAGGHGIEPWDGEPIKGAHVRYVPLAPDADPAAPSAFDGSDAAYALIDMFGPDGLWQRRDDADVFDGNGFRSNYGTGNATPPWRWRDVRYPDLPAGAIADDPAAVFRHFFQPPAGDGEAEPYLLNQYAAGAAEPRAAQDGEVDRLPILFTLDGDVVAERVAELINERGGVNETLQDDDSTHRRLAFDLEGIEVESGDVFVVGNVDLDEGRRVADAHLQMSAPHGLVVRATLTGMTADGEAASSAAAEVRTRGITIDLGAADAAGNRSSEVDVEATVAIDGQSLTYEHARHVHVFGKRMTFRGWAGPKTFEANILAKLRVDLTAAGSASLTLLDFKPADADQAIPLTLRLRLPEGVEPRVTTHEGLIQPLDGVEATIRLQPPFGDPYDVRVPNPLLTILKSLKDKPLELALEFAD